MTENVTSLKKKAHDLVQKGKLDSALKIFNLVVEEDPKEASVHNKIGDILLKLKQEDKAKEHFLTSAKLYNDEGLQMVALSICRKIIRAFPEEIEANLIMGTCYFLQNKNEQAKKEFLHYLKGKPSLDSPDVAIALKALAALDPDSPKWVSNLAKVAYKQENEPFLDYAVSISMERNHPDLEKISRQLKRLRAKLHPAPVKKRKPDVPAKKKKPEPNAPVKKRKPDVPVNKRKPDVTIEKPEPDVPVNKRKPDVTIEKPEPDVPVNKRKPEVTVEEPEPKVAIEELEPAVTIEEPEPVKKRKKKRKKEKKTEPDIVTSTVLDNLSFDEDDMILDDGLAQSYFPNDYKTDSKKTAAEDSQPETGERKASKNAKKNLEFDRSDIQQGRNESSDDILQDITDDDDEDWSIDEIENTGPQRIGEYFVASGLLKAGDVLRALEQQSSQPDGERLGNVLVAMNLVSVRQVREALSKQVADMRNRLERDPGDALGYIEMANLLLDVGDFYGAVGAYLRAAEIYRNDERDYMVFELLEGVLDICPESLSAAKEIVRIRHTIDTEGQSRAFYRLAVAYLLNDSPYEAIASLEAAVEVCPDYKDAKELMNGLRPDEHSQSGVTGVADILDDIDNVKVDTSKKALADIIMEFKRGVDSSITTEDYSTHFDLGIAYREMGLFREAIQEFEKVLVSPDYRIKAREMLGRCTFDMKRYDEAEDHFRKGLVLATTTNNESAIVGFHVNLCRVYEYTGRSGHAEAEKKIAEELDPVMARALQLE
ncbi:MAG: hypothetical protein KAH54_02995 [Candidatus Sabulitectum sp.]|nr:hypothetical protein [Candidatus Sabulitectum sp.]